MTIIIIYKLIVQPTLEYAYIWKCICNWGTHYILDQRKLEGVQQCATKLVLSLRDT